ncbi:PREDICTED: uncharacterized protein LOC109583611 [Amphimedon queenslandica]|uniref:Tyr recombinase domain-containing protein n=1 Tax=Amphimedon queenslandica TaxID=400682 RepID=A0A1X7UGD0_AMPQE|nr:PREDICTED: uncharacterized protein LOC109583611 [Amphimedon queenslandica]|eukprot:XP_019854593.1 PREDICTED: uncharacterized protein LOC109583611 [Amphimedon queenslandica]
MRRSLNHSEVIPLWKSHLNSSCLLRSLIISTIGRWIKSLLTDAGVNTSIFGAHSTRAASSSAAKKVGVPLIDIMKAAGWSRSSTFERFYYKPILSPQVGDILLSSEVPSSDDLGAVRSCMTIFLV